MNQNQYKALISPMQTSITNALNYFIKKFDFEFMDLNAMPSSLRATLRDILEVGNGTPFRNYYQWTATSVYEYASKYNIHEIVELGAGCAPITKHLIKKYPHWDAIFKITDLNPDKQNYQKMEQTDHRVKAVYESIDFTKKLPGFENSLLVLSATFHHIDENQKRSILNNLKKLSPHIMIIEPLRPTLASFLFVFGALISGFLTPIFRIKSKNFFRTFFWCWVVPIAPFLFLWDGWISAIRCWSYQEWLQHEPNALIEESLFCTKIQLGK